MTALKAWSALRQGWLKDAATPELAKSCSGAKSEVITSN